MDADIVNAVVSAYAKGEKAALITLCSTKGATPQRAGAAMLVLAAGKTVGTIGGGAIEHQAVREALEVIKTGVPRLWDKPLQELGMACGGGGTVFIEPLD